MRFPPDVASVQPSQNTAPATHDAITEELDVKTNKLTTGSIVLYVGGPHEIRTLTRCWYKKTLWWLPAWWPR